MRLILDLRPEPQLCALGLSKGGFQPTSAMR